MATPEGRVKEAVKKFLKERGIWYFMPVAGPFSAHGVPDFVCCYMGNFLAIETKAVGKLKTLTANQERVIGEIREHGGTVHVIDDVDTLKRLLGGGE